MPTPPYPVLCYEPKCGRLAVYKIAAHWSDGFTSELKTYGLTCESCLEKWFNTSLERQRRCRHAADEALDRPGIYRLTKGQLDAQLERLTDLESRLLAAPQ
jgi:hypothetical protein